MGRCPCVPRNLYDFLSPGKPLFRYAPARHVVSCCWLGVALLRVPGVGTRQGALPSGPAALSYGALLRMVRSGPWDAHAVLRARRKPGLRAFPPPAAGRLCLIGDTTHKTTRGRQHPLGHGTCQSESSPYTFGCDRVG